MSAGPRTTIVDAEVDGAVVDVAVAGGRIVAVGPDLPRRGTRVVAAGRGALLPGLHDHHLHLLAMAAAAGSLDLAAAADAAALDRAVGAAHAAAPPGAWLRAVGYDERHGPLDRHRLDRLAPGRPIRVQHRSGAAWVVSTAALRALGLDGGSPAGVALDPVGAPTGWLHRLDAELAGRWPSPGPPDLAGVGRRLAALGVTGVTDATPFADPGGVAALAAARRDGALPQRVVVMGGPALAGHPAPPEVERGPVKVVVADDALPGPDELVHAFRAARRAGRAVAVHCVTRVGLALALAAWDEVAPGPGDRVEHASVVPVELVGRLAEMGVRVVTQPALVAARGDLYLADVEPDDVAHLYRCRSLLAAGVPVAGSTDAPFGPADPWAAMRAAVERRTDGGRSLGADEALVPADALALFLGAAGDPGGPPRRVEPGAPADLCLLDRPRDRALADLSAEAVRATWIAGRPST